MQMMSEARYYTSRRRLRITFVMIGFFLFTSPIFIAAGETLVDRLNLVTHKRLLVVALFMRLWALILQVVRRRFAVGVAAFALAIAFATAYVVVTNRSRAYVMVEDLQRLFLLSLVYVPVCTALV